jgi:polyphosphate kinase
VPAGSTMKKKDKDKVKASEEPSESPDTGYKQTLYDLQVQLVQLQRHVISQGLKLLVVFEGRDAAGKDGTIKRIIEHLSPRETRVVALSKPSDRDQSSWYFQRFVPHLPVGGEIVLFNRSWYNRAGVERVMGFCTDAEYDLFLEDAPSFERLLVRDDTLVRKYYLDITKHEQKERLAERRRDPLTQWKISPLDAVALDYWEPYSEARNHMLERTHTLFAPWTIVRTDEKRTARINVIKHLLRSVDYKGKDEALLGVDPDVVFRYSEESVERLAP